MRKVCLNQNGLRKLLEYLDKEIPGISGKLIIGGESFHLPEIGVELIVRIPEPIEEQIPDPSLGKAPVRAATTIGKAPGSETQELGRAGVEKAKEEKFEDMVEFLRQYFPDKKELENALAEINRKLSKK